MKDIDYEGIISQLKAELNTECALANKYGIVLGSAIETFPKESIIPQKILELISSRKDIATELGLNRINSFAFAAKNYNYLFTFSESLILISKLELDVQLGKFMPNIRKFLSKLSKSATDESDLIKPFSDFDFSREIEQIQKSLEKKEFNKEKYSIVKELVKYLAK
jgi:hypothetical protein